MGKSKADEREYWTVEEFKKFSDAVIDKQDAWIGFNILFWTGIRLGEMLALTVEDIDFDEGTIRINKSLSKINGEVMVTEPKTESSNRIITIHKELQDRIREYIDGIYRARSTTRLFENRTKSFFEHELIRGIELSGVKKITVHGCRHSQASLCLQIGYSPLEIAKRLGHSRVTTTIETYCHPSMDAQKKIADSLGKADRGEDSAM